MRSFSKTAPKSGDFGEHGIIVKVMIKVILIFVKNILLNIIRNNERKNNI